jgi:hypothetical protein
MRVARIVVHGIGCHGRLQSAIVCVIPVQRVAVAVLCGRAVCGIENGFGRNSHTLNGPDRDFLDRRYWYQKTGTKNKDEKYSAPDASLFECID